MIRSDIAGFRDHQGGLSLYFVNKAIQDKGLTVE